jgi:hypothetical protein
MAAPFEADGGAAPSRRPANNAFTQQTLKAWRPILTPGWVVITFAAVGIVFIPIGVLCLVASQRVVEVVKQYDNTCCLSDCNDDAKRIDRNPCTITITVRAAAALRPSPRAPPARASLSAPRGVPFAEPRTRAWRGGLARARIRRCPLRWRARCTCTTCSRTTTRTTADT